MTSSARPHQYRILPTAFMRFRDRSVIRDDCTDRTGVVAAFGPRSPPVYPAASAQRIVTGSP